MCQEKENNLIEIGYWKDVKNKFFKRKIYISPKDFKKSIPNEITKGIFKSVYVYNSSDIDESLAIGDFYLDFDSPDDFELARTDAIKVLAYLKIVFKIQYEECNIFFSGRKGVHITIPYLILGIKPSKDINIVFKYIAENAFNYTKNKTVDLQIYDKKRLFRVPNTLHEKSNLYKIQLTYEELRDMSYEDIKSLAKSPRKLIRIVNDTNSFASKMYKQFEEKAIESLNMKSNIKSNQTLSYTPPCIISLMENGAKEGFRNNSIAVLASFYKACGSDSDRTKAIISEWNSKYNSPPTDSIEIEKTVMSIYSTNKPFGCNKIKTLSDCKENECKLVKNKIKKR